MDLGLFKEGVCPSPMDIIEELSKLSNDQLGQFSSFSSSIYETAWLAMIYTNEGNCGLHFPECFDHILEKQGREGTWPSYGSQIDGILNTLAALIAIIKRRNHTDLEYHDIPNLDERIQNACAGVQKLLHDWDVNLTDHVGFEVLVTSLLRQLESFDVFLPFSGRDILSSKYREKMRKFTPEVIYASRQTTLLHPLESLCGMIDFERVSHHCSEEAGICGSPSATASYFINTTDPRARIYLEKIAAAYRKCGGIPNAFPTCIFEITWALSSLFKHCTFSEDVAVDVSNVTLFLKEVLEKQMGVVGFAPGLLPDADDTARMLITLRRLSQDIDPTPMINMFEAPDHFVTYPMERNSSLSANCNVLVALLEFETVDSYVSQIGKTLTFILERCDLGDFSDKWNTCPYYSTMLIVESLIGTLSKYNSGQLRSLPEEMVQRLPTTLCELLQHTLAGQEDNGGWLGSIEATSYCAITLSQFSSLPWDSTMQDHLTDSLSRARVFIKSLVPNGPSGVDQYFWIEKTTYQSRFLKIVYCSIALHSVHMQRLWSENVSVAFSTPEMSRGKMGKLLLTLPMFKKFTMARMQLILMNASHYSKRLRIFRSYILQRDDMSLSKDRYLDYISILWLACNHKGGHFLSPKIIHEMALISLLNFQVDEFMETVIAELPQEKVRVLAFALRYECGLHPGRSNLEFKPGEASSTGNELRVLRKFINHILHHPAVLRSPQWIKQSLTIEVHNFLIAHINHITDNLSLSPAKEGESHGPLESYFKWVHSTGADDTSCPYSFIFFSCLISTPGENCFEGPQATYFSQSLVRHLAVMCRQYNDYGSVERDCIEKNINSLDFAEFHRNDAEGNLSADHDVDRTISPGVQETSSGGRNGHLGITPTLPSDKAKADLMAIAEFERCSMLLSLDKLAQAIQKPDIIKQLRVFVDVTDTFGQIYVAKDIASRKQ